MRIQTDETEGVSHHSWSVLLLLTPSENHCINLTCVTKLYFSGKGKEVFF